MPTTAARLLLMMLVISFSYSGDYDPSIYDKYRIKELSYTVPQFQISSTFHHDIDHIDNIDDNSNDFDRTQFIWSTRARLSFNHYYESEKRIINTIISAYRDDYKRKLNQIDSGTLDDKSESLNYNIFGHHSRILYAEHSDAFIYWGASVNTNSHTDFIERESNSEYWGYYYKEEYLSQNQSDQLELSYGSGRVRDVTSLHKALLLIDRLKETHPEAVAMSEDNVLELAQALEGRKGFVAQYYRYNKYYWESVSSVFDSIGYSIDNLDMRTALYINEAINLLHFSRYQGSHWRIGVQLSYEKFAGAYSSYDQNDQILSEWDEYDEGIYFLINSSYSWYKPLSFKSQVSFLANLSAGPGIDPTPEYYQRYELNCVAGYQYDVTDKMMLSSEVDYCYNRWNGTDALYRNELLFNQSINYYIIDNFHLNLEYKYGIIQSNEIGVNLPQDFRNIDNRVTLSLTFGPTSPNMRTY